MSNSKVVRLSEEQINLIMFAIYDKIEKNLYSIKQNDVCIDQGFDITDCKEENYLLTSNIEYYREIAIKLDRELSFNAIFNHYNQMSLKNFSKVLGYKVD